MIINSIALVLRYHLFMLDISYVIRGGVLTRAARLFCVPGLNYCVFAPMPVTHGYVFPPPYSSSFTTTKVPTTTTMTMMSAMIKTNTGAKMLNKKFYCANCSSGFSRKGGLTYHQKFECGQQPRFSCPYCVYCARHISNARRHVRKCHPGQDVRTIDLCELRPRNP